MERPFEIQVLKPSQLSLDDYFERDLVELVSKGYGYSGDMAYLLEKTQEEYTADDKRMDIYLMMQDKRAIGSLCLLDWGPHQDRRGKPFWDKLRSDYPEVYAFLAVNKSAVDISGIVTHPDYRGLGVARRLVEYGIKRVNPNLVLAQTKTPAAVLTTSRSLGRLGYSTFLGGVDVTPIGTLVKRSTYKAVKDCYIKARGVEEGPGGVLLEDPELLLPDVPDVSSLPFRIQEAFQPIITAQKQIGSQFTAVLPLISIKNPTLTSFS